MSRISGINLSKLDHHRHGHRQDNQPKQAPAVKESLTRMCLSSVLHSVVHAVEIHASKDWFGFS